MVDLLGPPRRGGRTDADQAPDLIALYEWLADVYKALLAPVDLANESEVTGNLGVTHFDNGTGATNTKFWRGDGTWASLDETELGELLVSIRALGSQGFIVNVGGGVAEARTLVGGTGISVLQGSGVAGDPEIVLADTLGAAGGPTGSSSVVPIITYNAQGQLTAVSTANITPAAIGAVPTTRLLNTTAPLAGGGDLSVDRTLSITAAALTKTDDTNVTLTLGGAPATALLAATSITVGWTGTLAAARLNANVVQGTTNDTNVTGAIGAQVLTLGWTGTLAAARLNANVVQAVTNDTNVTGSISAQNLTFSWAGTLAATRGGTGQGSYAVGDILYASTTTALSRLADVATGNALISGGLNTAPAWGKVGLTTHISGVLAEANGGTNQSTYTAGDLLQASAANTLAKLAAVATGNALISGGIGVASSWGKIGLTTHVSGTLAIGNGGTGQITAAAAFDALAPTTTRGDIITRGASSNGRLAVGAAARFLRSDGTDPSWAQVALTTDVTGTLPVANGGTGTTTGPKSTMAFGNTNASLATGATHYWSTTGAYSSANEAAAQVPVPFAATIKNLYVSSNQAPGVGQTYTITLRKNTTVGGDQTLTCTISGGTAVSANDTTHSFTVVAGDTIDVKAVSSAGATNAAFITATIELDAS